jgi:hypothetical protein
MNQDNKNLKKIKYTLLKDIEEPGEYNCYGIIYDASFPQYLEKKEKDNNTLNYGCTIKLIDQYPIIHPDIYRSIDNLLGRSKYDRRSKNKNKGSKLRNILDFDIFGQSFHLENHYLYYYQN